MKRTSPLRRGCQALTVLLCTGAVQAQADDWPMLRNNPARTAATTAAGPSSSQLAWQNLGASYYRAPVVATRSDGKQVAASLAPNSNYTQFSLSVLDAATGQQLAASPAFSGNGTGGLAVGGDVAVFAVSNIQSEFVGPSYIYGVSLLDGSVLWQYYAHEGSVSLGEPAIIGDDVYYLISEFIGYNGLLEARSVVHLDRTTGAFLGKDFISYAEDGNTVSLANGVIYAGGFDRQAWRGYTRAFDAATGNKLWDGPTSTWGFYNAPPVADGRVFWGNVDGFIIGVDTATGQELWRNTSNFGGSTNNDPAYANGVLYFNAYTGLFALDAATGQTLWQAPWPTNSYVSSIAVAGGTIYATASSYSYNSTSYTESGNLLAIDAQTGALKWSGEIGGAGDFALAGGKLYANTYKYSYDFTTNTSTSVTGLSCIGGQPILPVTVSGGSVASSSYDPVSKTYTYQLQSGSTAFALTLPQGTQPIAPATTIGLTLQTSPPAILIQAQLPAGTTKSVSLPRGSGKQLCIKDTSGAQIGGTRCPGGTYVPLPVSGCTTPTVNGDPADGPHSVTVCTSGNVTTVSGLLHSALQMTLDSDGDGVIDDFDRCPNTNINGPIPTAGTLRPGNIGDSSVIDGCNATQILACKPGSTDGEHKYGVTPGSQNVFQSIDTTPIGWATSCAQMYPLPQ